MKKMSQMSAEKKQKTKGYVAKVSRTTLVPPQLTEIKGFNYKEKLYDIKLQYSVHRATRSMVTECLTVFPNLTRESDLVCIPTFQLAHDALTDWTPEAAFEKDRLLLSFYAWAQALCECIQAKGHWADYIDPCSGYPVMGDRGSSIYSEVDGMQALLKYRIQSVGGCGILFHPDWGSCCYPASVFCVAPLEVVQAALVSTNQKFSTAAPKPQETTTPKLQKPAQVQPEAVAE